MQRLLRTCLLAALICVGGSSAVHAQMSLEHIAHACFVVESPGGHRLLLDPYNGNTWMGYGFPQGIEADGIAITHPHYDHDASYYIGAPTFREPGDYQIGDIRMRGIEAEHAGAPRFLERGVTPHNVIWLVEVDGVRLAHLGDNGTLTEDVIDALGRVDILIARATGELESLEPILSRLGVRVLIPNHYRLPEVSDMPKVLMTVDEWLGAREAKRLGSNRASFDAESLPDVVERVVFPPSGAVKPWPAHVHEAWAELAAADALPGDDPRGREHLRAAVDLAPGVLKFHLLHASSLEADGDRDGAIAALEAGLARLPRADWTDEVRARALLGRLYASSGDMRRAEAQYRWVLSHRRSYAAEALEEARRFIEQRDR